MKNGPYILVTPPNNYPGKKYRGKYAYEHHVVYWKCFSVIPKPGEVIHHKNEIKSDNRIENLILITSGEHAMEHNWIDPLEIICSWCNSIFHLKPNRFRTRSKKNDDGVLFCGKSCSAQWQYSAGKIKNNLHVSAAKIINVNCQQCGNTLTMLKRRYNQKIAKNKFGVFCDAKCSRKYQIIQSSTIGSFAHGC